MWTDEELKELEEDEDQWDWEHAVVHEPVPAEERRVRLAIDFSRDEFYALADAAERNGIKLTEFVRRATRAAAQAAPTAPARAHD